MQFVLGDSDAMTWPKAARAMATALKAQVHVVRAGHNLMTEAPEATLAALRETLA